jgi:hypothetical protein
MLCRQNKAITIRARKKGEGYGKGNSFFERLPRITASTTPTNTGQNREHEAEAAHLRRRGCEQISGKCLIIA